MLVKQKKKCREKNNDNELILKLTINYDSVNLHKIVNKVLNSKINKLESRVICLFLDIVIKRKRGTVCTNCSSFSLSNFYFF